MDPETPEPKSADAKSSASRTSIKVKIPSAGEDLRKKTSSPSIAGPRRTPVGGSDIRKSPSAPILTGEFVATLEGQEFGQYRQLTTPASSTRSPTPGKHLRQPAVTETELVA